jgi:hypothetical protein
MKAIYKVGVVAAGLLYAAGLIICLIAFGLAVRSVIATTQEQIRYDTFQQSSAHIKGTINDLRGLQSTYLVAEPEQKPMLRAIIVKRADDTDSAKTPDDLAFFIDDMRRKAQSPLYVDEE